MNQKNMWRMTVLVMLMAAAASCNSTANAQQGNAVGVADTSGHPEATASPQKPSAQAGSIGVVFDLANAGSTGVRLVYVVRGGPADEAGLGPGDLITAADDIAVSHPTDLTKIVRASATGVTITIRYLREGIQKQAVVIVLGRDKVEALYRKAAEQGDAAAQEDVAFMYLSGSGVPQDYAQAIAWLHKAAERGSTNAQAFLKELPPGNALSISAPEARAAIRAAIGKRLIGKMESCARVLWVKGCETIEPSEATGIRVSAAGFDFTAPYTLTLETASHQDGKMSLRFKKGQTYIQAYRFDKSASKVTWNPSPLYNVGYLPNPERNPLAYVVFEWTDETTAQQFADAFNRLLFAASHNEDAYGFAAFSAAAKAWRDNPIKPPLGVEAGRQRILAENAFNEKNLDDAIEHYESGVEAQPIWPAGWYNLALLYAEQNNYADAVDRQKHYLELVPDASDAQNARNQMIIWEDKAAKQQ
jgi:TPR repeat protein